MVGSMLTETVYTLSGERADAPLDPLLQSERTQGFTAGPVYSRAKCLPMLGSLKTYRT